MLTVNSLVGFGAKRSSPSSPNYYGTGAEGDYTVSSNTTLDGGGSAEMLVKNYNNLLINNGVQFLLKQRKGSLIYCLGDCTINGTLKAESGYSCDPSAAGVPAGGLVIARRTNGSSSGSSILTGCGSTATTSEANQASVSGNGTIWTIPRAGGNGGVGGVKNPGPGGNTGASPTTASGGTGGGGGGSAYAGNDIVSASGGNGAAGTCFSGGAGGGAAISEGPAWSHIYGGNATGNGGAGGAGASGSYAYGNGGAGNPGGAGWGGYPAGEYCCGGLLILVVRGNLTVGASGLTTAKGGSGHPSSPSGYQSAGSGGGVLLILYKGVLTNNGSIVANGGVGGDMGAAGSVTTAQIL